MNKFLFSLQIFILLALGAATKSSAACPFSSERFQLFNLEALSSSKDMSAILNSVELSWSEVAGANAYLLIVTDNGLPFLQTTVFGTTKTLNGLITGHTYRCMITVIGGAQESDYIIMNDIMP